MEFPAGYTKDVLTNKCTKKPVVDLCKNLEGNQTSLPKNHARNEDGTCYNKLTAPKPVVKVYDWCTNIPETQTFLPVGMMRPKEGTECVLIVPPVVVVDRCSEIFQATKLLSLKLTTKEMVLQNVSQNNVSFKINPSHLGFIFLMCYHVYIKDIYSNNHCWIFNNSLCTGYSFSIRYQ